MYADIVAPAQETLSTIAQAEAENIEGLRYRWLTHASRLCDERKRGKSESPLLAFLDIWAFEYHKQEGQFLQAEAARARRVVDPVVLPLHRFAGGTGGHGLERRPHPVLKQYSGKDTNTDAEDNTGCGSRGDVIGDQTRNNDSRASPQGSASSQGDFEAKAFKTRHVSNTHGIRIRAATSALTMRDLRASDGSPTHTIRVPRSSDERTDSKTACCRNSCRGRSSSAENAFAHKQQVVLGKVRCRLCRKQDRSNDRAIECGKRRCAGRSISDFDITPSSGIRCSNTGDATFEPVEYEATGAHECCDRDAHDGSSKRCPEDDSFGRAMPAHSFQPVSHHSKVSLPREHPKCCQEYACTYKDTNSCSNLRHGECDRCRYSTNVDVDHSACRGEGAYSPQIKASSYALASDCEGSLGVDGASEEAEPRELGTVRRNPFQRPTAQVASRIREYELKNAMPMPRHFRPAGHTRHDKDSRNHPWQLHRDEKPVVDLIFPLHVNRFPRRTSDGSPFRPETPLHHSIPEDEPYIHAPQPARSMPMLKDPPEHESQPPPQPETLDISRGNSDGFAVASRYGRRASRNFAVRRNSRP